MLFFTSYCPAAQSTLSSMLFIITLLCLIPTHTPPMRDWQIMPAGWKLKVWVLESAAILDGKVLSKSNKI